MFTSKTKAFWRGVGSVLDLTGGVDEFRRLRTLDADALARDWYTVGLDIHSAMESVRRERGTNQLGLFEELSYHGKEKESARQ